MLLMKAAVDQGRCLDLDEDGRWWSYYSTRILVKTRNCPSRRTATPRDTTPI